MHWQLQEAKNKLSKVVQEARTSGPQTITVRGEKAAVVISPETYHELIRRKDSLVASMQRSPWAEVELDVERSRDLGRDAEP